MRTLKIVRMEASGLPKCHYPLYHVKYLPYFVVEVEKYTKNILVTMVPEKTKPVLVCCHYFY
jgi:hypothetical protein